ncbi:hypothetical protein B0H13DRAFT_2056457 [Mycena leptocephala]|nr:hypothetical protein B0H13DRAFT_2056457 [Mycena leptocephala]
MTLTVPMFRALVVIITMADIIPVYAVTGSAGSSESSRACRNTHPFLERRPDITREVQIKRVRLCSYLHGAALSVRIRPGNTLRSLIILRK